MNNVPFTLSQVRPIRDAMTVSRPSGLGYGVPVTWFSLGAGTSITPEYYDCTTLYLGGEGNGRFLLGVDGQEVSVKPGEVLYVPPKTLCGTKTDSLQIGGMKWGITTLTAPFVVAVWIVAGCRAGWKNRNRN